MLGLDSVLHDNQYLLGAFRLLRRDVPDNHLEPIPRQKGKEKQVLAVAPIRIPGHSIPGSLPITKCMLSYQIALRPR